jgi:hypothetical protein
LTVLAFDRKKLAQDTLSAISQFGASKKDVGHDAPEYAVGRAHTVLPAIFAMTALGNGAPLGDAAHLIRSQVP